MKTDRSMGWAALGVAGAAAAAVWGTDSAPYPVAQRWILNLPLPLLTPRRLERILAPREGERMLEVGPGTGLQSLPVARRLGASGRLDIVDIQQPMLDHVTRRAARRGIRTIEPTLADARALPFPDATFDAAYLVTVLGEIPGDPRDALRELRRVLKPAGRVIVGEFADRHYVPLLKLASRAHDAGLHLVRHTGVPFAYCAELRVCG
ncbi:methyltransferase domain-containing protein [Amycolatopsis sp. NPDC026612]|uniref:class I SAM-dependent methyltransferase n=1 Tax=Amycolatopsis sp. NPDC026612 TaxID=3155466 RepID=UPI0033C05098